MAQRNRSLAGSHCFFSCRPFVKAKNYERDENILVGDNCLAPLSNKTFLSNDGSGLEWNLGRRIKRLGRLGRPRRIYFKLALWRKFPASKPLVRGNKTLLPFFI